MNNLVLSKLSKMNADERTILKKKMEVEIASLSGKIEELKESVKPIPPENAIGRISRMDAINNKSVNEAALKKSLLRLESLQAALENINDKSYGICARCGIEIPMGRLLLRPQSRSCVNCAH